MKIKKILLTLLPVLFISLLVSLLILNSYKKAQHRLTLTQSRLRDNKIEEAKEQFYKLENSLWIKNKAHLGTLIINVLNGEKVNYSLLPDKESIFIEDYFLPQLMQRELLSASFTACINLARIGRFYRLMAADLFLAAALLEKGQSDEAIRLYSQLPVNLKNSYLGKRLAISFDLLDRGAAKIVRDRNGIILGTIDIGGEFNFHRKVYGSILQPGIINETLDSEFLKGIRLSIDLQLSSLARLRLGNHRGSIVLVEPETGEILAAVCDKRTAKQMGNGSSPPFEQMLEPASISKLITITAAFRNKLNIEEQIDRINCRGFKRYSGKILYCPAAKGKLHGLNHALAVSCNIAFADLAVKVGWEKMLEELRLFGFDNQTATPYPLGDIIIGQGDDRNLADLGIGLENTVVTPLHTALIAAVFANDGYWVSPQLFHAGDGLIGISPQKQSPLPRAKILFEEWLPAIREAMWTVTRDGGTAAYVAPFGSPVYMKTGTGGNYRDGFHINYIGYTSTKLGTIAFSVRITGKRTSFRARKAGYEVTKHLLSALNSLHR